MSKNFTIYLNDIRKAINSIEIFVEGMTFIEGNEGIINLSKAGVHF